MSEKAPDRRALKTRKTICSVFAGLLTEKELHKITVQEIVDRADIGRATFYKHYLDIYDLYEKIEKDTITEIAMFALNIGEQSVETFFKSLLSYISDNREIFRMIFSPNNTGQLYVRLSKMIEGVFRSDRKRENRRQHQRQTACIYQRISCAGLSFRNSKVDMGRFSGLAGGYSENSPSAR